jgi:hypothetical protein
MAGISRCLPQVPHLCNSHGQSHHEVESLATIDVKTKMMEDEGGIPAEQ